MMDDFDDFQAVFFQECEELLGDLQDHLESIADGDFDAETLNAAFRAVHSIKGGAGAFGFDHLVNFAHIFETVMDKLRSDELDANPTVTKVLLRSNDVIADLVADAQNGAPPRDNVERVRLELEALINPAAADAAPVADAGQAAASTPAPAAPETQASQTAPEVLAEPEEEAEPTRDVTIRIAPGPEFIHSGHDMVKLIRAFKSMGDVRVETEGELPPLSDHDAVTTQLVWTLTLNTAETISEIEEFYDFYAHTADFTITDSSVAEEAVSAEAEPAAPVQEETVAEQAQDVQEQAQEPLEASSATVVELNVSSEGQVALDEVKAAVAQADAAEKAEKAAAPKATEAPKKAAASNKAAKTLRVELNRVDRLVNMVGEIVITQAVLNQKISEVDLPPNNQVAQAIEQLSHQTRELQESVMAIRAQPVKSVFSRMPRVVRDLADQLGKEVTLELAGEHTEVDTTVIEELAEPLTHMLRNSMDHGLEMPDAREAAGKPRCGTVWLTAEHRGERVTITLEDDGAGINRDRVLAKAIEKGIVPEEAQLTPEEIDMLIFAPGFSTAAAVSNVSGRGVGMDVVKKKVQALGGRVSLQNNPGKGAKFVITLPLTLAVLDGMTIGIGDERFVLPLGSVVEALKISDDVMETLPSGSHILRYRDNYIPLLSVRDLLGLDPALERESLAVVVETETDGKISLLVDELIGQRQVVLKSLEANFKRIEGISGATILGDGRVALILDVPALHALGTGHNVSALRKAS
ncbi:MAG: chemotaxis protein CheA [Neomegalonema sp.]|nr:chemotaxis protein CheA [Neomegalonema sp.]